MTIAGRNRILILNMGITALLALSGVLCIVFIFLKRLPAALPVPPQSSVWLFKQPLFIYNHYAAAAGAAVFPLLSFGILIYTFFLFEKTHALEISFFSSFIFALAFEPLRLLFVFQEHYPLTMIFSAPVARTVFFFRFFASFSLFTAGLFVHKTFTRQTETVFFIIGFVSFSLAQAIPVNTGRTLSHFLFSETYFYLFYSCDGIICLLGVLSFVYVGVFRSIPEYRKAGLLLFILLAGYWLLLFTGAWFFVAGGTIVFLSAAILFVRTIHRFYLWQ